MECLHSLSALLFLFTVADDIYTLMSATNEDDVPFIAVIEGDPNEWTNILKGGGGLRTGMLSGNANVTSFQKLGFHQGKGTVVYSDGKDGNVESFPLLGALAGTASLKLAHAFTSVEVNIHNLYPHLPLVFLFHVWLVPDDHREFPI